MCRLALLLPLLVWLALANPGPARAFETLDDPESLDEPEALAARDWSMHRGDGGGRGGGGRRQFFKGVLFSGGRGGGHRRGGGGRGSSRGRSGGSGEGFGSSGEGPRGGSSASGSFERGYGKGRGHGFGRCPRWQPWEESKCIWAGDDMSAMPASCHAFNVTSLPEPIIQYYKAKGSEMPEIINAAFKRRGLTKPCGYCSRKFACRARSRRVDKGEFCRPIQFGFVNEECESGEPCQLSAVDGACPPPIDQSRFLQFNRRQRLLAAKFGRRGRGGWGSTRGGWGSRRDRDDPAASGEDKNKSAPVVVVDSGEQVSSAEQEVDKKQRYSLDIPLWHCLKNKDGKCSCCCGGYFPDLKTGKCVKVKHGNRYPPLDFSEGIHTGI